MKIITRDRIAEAKAAAASFENRSDAFLLMKKKDTNMKQVVLTLASPSSSSSVQMAANRWISSEHGTHLRWLYEDARVKERKEWKTNRSQSNKLHKLSRWHSSVDDRALRFTLGKGEEVQEVELWFTDHFSCQLLAFSRPKWWMTADQHWFKDEKMKKVTTPLATFSASGVAVHWPSIKNWLLLFGLLLARIKSITTTIYCKVREKSSCQEVSLTLG